jgi:hypothetical protein
MPRIDRLDYSQFMARPRACHDSQGDETMSKRARKRRTRKGNAANHGKKPNA